jgi:hypothetical protein
MDRKGRGKPSPPDRALDKIGEWKRKQKQQGMHPDDMRPTTTSIRLEQNRVDDIKVSPHCIGSCHKVIPHLLQTW